MLPSLLTLLVALYHLYVVLQTTVNLPYWDEWESLRTGALNHTLSLSWLFRFHNEHCIVLTKLLTWILFQTCDWNFPVALVINYLIFVTLVLTLLTFQPKASREERVQFLWFFPFLFSMVPSDNHASHFQSQFHFMILFTLLAARLLFRAQPTHVTFGAGIACAVVAIFSMAGGVPAALTLIGVFWLRQLLLLPETEAAAGIAAGITRSEQRAFQGKKSWIAGALLSVSLLLAIGVWRQGYHAPAAHPAFLYPNSWQFYEFLLNSVAYGFGVGRISTLRGAFCLAWILIPLALNLKNAKQRQNPDTWALLGASLALLAMIGAITMGRGAGGPSQAKAPRYGEIALFLMPLSLLAWKQWLRSFTPSVRRRFMAGAWALLALSFSHQYRFSYYQELESRKKEAIPCILNYYEQSASGASTHSDGFCPQVYPAPLEECLERARELNVSFYQELKLHHSLQLWEPKHE